MRIKQRAAAATVLGLVAMLEATAFAQQQPVQPGAPGNPAPQGAQGQQPLVQPAGGAGGAAAPPAGGGAAGGAGGAPAGGGAAGGGAGGGGTTPTQVKTLTEADLLAGRCATALCFPWPNGHPAFFAIEPLVELPIGKSFTFNSGGLADYINNTDVGVTFTAGLRAWLLWDWVSFSLYLSQPLTPKDTELRANGSSFQYPATYVRRSFPGMGIGLFFDTLWIGIDRDQLHNGADGSSTAVNPAYPPSAVISSVWTFTVAIQPITAFRTGIGTALSKSNSSKPQ